MVQSIGPPHFRHDETSVETSSDWPALCKKLVAEPELEFRPPESSFLHSLEDGCDKINLSTKFRIQNAFHLLEVSR